MIGILILLIINIIICTVIIVSDNRRQHRKTRRAIKHESSRQKNLYRELSEMLGTVLKSNDIAETIKVANEFSDDFDKNFECCTYVGNAKDLNKNGE